MGEELNNRLDVLRYRLFGDQTDQPPSDSGAKQAGGDMSIEARIQNVHYLMNQALAQVEAIHARL